MAKNNKKNISANDLTLTHGVNDDNYMYSVGDGHVIAIALREKYLNYENKAEVSDGNSYPALRENNNDILLLDPCHIDNFTANLDDEIQKLVVGIDGIEKWKNMPQTIIIPFLADAHWRVVVVNINYEDNSASLLWDDPYGRRIDYMPRDKIEVGEIVIDSVKLNVERLMKNHTHNPSFNFESKNFTISSKDIEQQPMGIDSTSCGIIVFQNIEDYLYNITDGKGIDNINYTIGDYGSDYSANHDVYIANLRSIKDQHAKMYLDVSSEGSDDLGSTSIEPNMDSDHGFDQDNDSNDKDSTEMYEILDSEPITADENISTDSQENKLISESKYAEGNILKVTFLDNTTDDITESSLENATNTVLPEQDSDFVSSTISKLISYISELARNNHLDKKTRDDISTLAETLNARAIMTTKKIAQILEDCVHDEMIDATDADELRHKISLVLEGYDNDNMQILDWLDNHQYKKHFEVFYKELQNINTSLNCLKTIAYDEVTIRLNAWEAPLGDLKDGVALLTAKPDIDFDNGTVSGKIIGAKDIAHSFKSVNHVKVNAFLFLLDSNIEMHGKDLSIDSTMWNLNGSKLIDLSGEDGIDGWNRENVNHRLDNPRHKALDGIKPGEDGQNGLDGTDGGNSGSFYGHTKYLTKSKDASLILDLRGGRGGNGQHGGNGADGKDGVLSSDFLSKKIKLKEHDLIQGQKKLELLQEIKKGLDSMSSCSEYQPIKGKVTKDDLLQIKAYLSGKITVRDYHILKVGGQDFQYSDFEILKSKENELLKLEKDLKQLEQDLNNDKGHLKALDKKIEKVNQKHQHTEDTRKSFHDAIKDFEEKIKDLQKNTNKSNSSSIFNKCKEFIELAKNGESLDYENSHSGKSLQQSESAIKIRTINNISMNSDLSKEISFYKKICDVLENQLQSINDAKKKLENLELNYYTSHDKDYSIAIIKENLTEFNSEFKHAKKLYDWLENEIDDNLSAADYIISTVSKLKAWKEEFDYAHKTALKQLSDIENSKDAAIEAQDVRQRYQKELESAFKNADLNNDAKKELKNAFKKVIKMEQELLAAIAKEVKGAKDLFKDDAFLIKEDDDSYIDINSIGQFSDVVLSSIFSSEDFKEQREIFTSQAGKGGDAGRGGLSGQAGEKGKCELDFEGELIEITDAGELIASNNELGHDGQDGIPGRGGINSLTTGMLTNKSSGIINRVKSAIKSKKLKEAYEIDYGRAESGKVKGNDEVEDIIIKSENNPYGLSNNSYSPLLGESFNTMHCLLGEELGVTGEV